MSDDTSPLKIQHHITVEKYATQEDYEAGKIAETTEVDATTDAADWLALVEAAQVSKEND